MFREVIQQVKPAMVLLLSMSLVTGVIYPLLVTGFALVFFPHHAEGSLIERDGVVIGSRLIGQAFDDTAYFWGRPSATNPIPYNAAASSGSNDGSMSELLAQRIEARMTALQSTDPVPVDLVTASASGLDPHITPAAAFYQVPRVAAARDIDEITLRQLVEDHIEGRVFGILGEPRVNVLLLNLALDEAFPRNIP